MGLVGLRGLATGKPREARARLRVRCGGGGGWRGRGGGAAVAAHAEIRPPSARPPPVSAASAPAQHHRLARGFFCPAAIRCSRALQNSAGISLPSSSQWNAAEWRAAGVGGGGGGEDEPGQEPATVLGKQISVALTRASENGEDGQWPPCWAR